MGDKKRAREPDSSPKGDKVMWGKARHKPIIVEFREPIPHARSTFESIDGVVGWIGSGTAHLGNDYVIKDSDGKLTSMKINDFVKLYEIMSPIQSSTPLPSTKGSP